MKIEKNVIKYIRSLLGEIKYYIVGYIDNHNKLTPNIDIIIQDVDKDIIISLLNSKDIKFETKDNIINFFVNEVMIKIHFVENINWIKFIKGYRKYDKNGNLNKFREILFNSIISVCPVKIISYYDEYFNIDKYIKYELSPYDGVYEITYSYVDEKNNLKRIEKEISRKIKTNKIKEFKKLFLGEKFTNVKVKTLENLIDIIEDKEFLFYNRKNMIYINMYKEIIKKNLIDKLNDNIKKVIYDYGRKCNSKIF